MICLQAFLDETHILWAPHKGDTVTGKYPLQHGSGRWSTLTAHAWKLYTGQLEIHTLSEGETLGVAEADFCSVGFGSLILGKKISITEYLAVLCHKK